MLSWDPDVLRDAGSPRVSQTYLGDSPSGPSIFIDEEAPVLHCKSLPCRIRPEKSIRVVA